MGEEELRKAAGPRGAARPEKGPWLEVNLATSPGITRREEIDLVFSRGGFEFA